MKLGLKAFFIYLFVPMLLTIIFFDFVNKNLLHTNIIIYLALLLIFLIYSRKTIMKDFFDFKNNFKKYIPIIVKWLILGFILMLCSNFIISLFIDNLPNNELNNREMIINSPGIGLLYLLLIAPSLEEYVFRFSFRNIKNYYFFTIFTSLLFASLHLLSIDNLSHIFYVIPYFCLSFGFSNIYFKTKNYFATTIGHIIHNILCVIIILVF